jgi:hypothetical protein
VLGPTDGRRIGALGQHAYAHMPLHCDSTDQTNVSTREHAASNSRTAQQIPPRPAKHSDPAQRWPSSSEGRRWRREGGRPPPGSRRAREGIGSRVLRPLACPPRLSPATPLSGSNAADAVALSLPVKPHCERTDGMTDAPYTHAFSVFLSPCAPACLPSARVGLREARRPRAQSATEKPFCRLIQRR